MKFLIKLSLININRRKKDTIANVFIITLAMLLIIFVFSLIKSLNFFIDNVVYNATDFRTILVDCFSEESYNAAQDFFKRQKNILISYPYVQDREARIVKENENRVSAGEESFLFLKPYNKSAVPKVINGKELDKNDRNAGLIPEKFLKTYMDVGTQKDNQEFLNGSDYIGKYITVEYESFDYTGDEMISNGTHKYTFKVVGTYNAVEQLIPPNTMYIPYEDLQDINHWIEENSKGFSADLSMPYTVIVDRYENVEKTVIEINNVGGYNARVISKLGKIGDIKAYIIYITSILIVLLVIVSFVNISLTVVKSVKNRTEEIGLLKAIGYANRNIRSIINLEMLIISCISIIITGIFFVVIYKLLNNLFLINRTYLNNFTFTIDYAGIVLSLFICVLLPLLSSLLAVKHIHSIEPSVALKE